jgi:hypothetical protein
MEALGGGPQVEYVHEVDDEVDRRLPAAASASISSIWWRSPSTSTTQVRRRAGSRASAWPKAAAMTSPASRATEPVSHLAVACGPRRTSRSPVRLPAAPARAEGAGHVADRTQLKQARSAVEA